MTYQPHIDGLRAFAVLSVLFYHAGFPVVAGGYVGVDIFLVISGFLITRILMSEMDGPRGFEWSSFARRRLLRLGPALAAVLLVTALGSALVLSPIQYESFGYSLVAAAFSVSNFFFWSESGYFDLGSHTKPLLHTWSLGLEVQFYIVWSILLVFLSRWRTTATVAAAIVLLVASLLAAEVFNGEEGTAFFLLPFRMFEFLVGALLVWVAVLRAPGKLMGEGLTLLSYALLLYPVLFYSNETPFPSFYALVPCLGAALFIYAGGTTRVGRILSNSLMQRIGEMSYSIYLVHWPLIVLYTIWKFHPISDIDRWALCAASLVFGVLLYRTIEKPYRRVAVMPGRIAAVSLALLTFYGGVAAQAVATQGWPGRFQRPALQCWQASSGRTLESSTNIRARPEHTANLSEYRCTQGARDRGQPGERHHQHDVVFAGLC